MTVVVVVGMVGTVKPCPAWCGAVVCPHLCPHHHLTCPVPLVEPVFPMPSLYAMPCHVIIVLLLCNATMANCLCAFFPRPPAQPAPTPMPVPWKTIDSGHGLRGNLLGVVLSVFFCRIVCVA